MDKLFSRTTALLGEDALIKLQQAKVAVFGLGGVGGQVAESLARAGVGTLVLIDHDVVSVSNINRQVIALKSTVGKKKTAIMGRRIKDINPDCTVIEKDLFFLPDCEETVITSDMAYVADCIDTVSGKLEIISQAQALSVPVISALGTGNKLCPELLRIGDIAETEVCPLARVMRRELKKRDIHHLPVVWSPEVPQPTKLFEDGKPIPGSVSFVPPAAGLLMASKIIRDIIERSN
ncbi:MAG: tRNA threonylcarbamoyladenosine dehydratase [Clostridia bacterium]|nr:tRNA threonylcarbamoyladenosine dehydratase [Clostridia bacterium]